MNELITEYRMPVRLMRCEGKVEKASNLLIRQELQIGLQENILCEVNGKSCIVLDFGEELVGGIRILTFFAAGNAAKVRIRFGESMSEAMSELGENGSSNDHSLRDFETTLVNWSDMQFGCTGFRFVRIDFLENRILSIKSIVARYTHRHLKQIYEYAGADKEIKTIFDTAKHTMQLCMQEYVWDGIKRDRLVWVGDMHPEMLAITTLFGRQKVLEDSLDFVRDQAVLPQWMNGMPTYSLWWLIIEADYYTLTGNTAYAKKQLPYYEELLKQFDLYIAADGTMSYPSYFLDWQTCQTENEEPGSRAISELALKRAISFLAKFGRDTTRPQAMLNRLMQVEIKTKSSKQVLGLKYLVTGSLSPEEAKILTSGGARGMSTFMSYYVLKAVAETSGKAVAIEMMKTYYGAMLSRGATSFWEDFNMDWLENSSRIDELPLPHQRDLHGDYGDYCYKGFRHSLCHGWSSGVIKFIQEYCD